jgi:hypothetical protein
LEIKKRVKASVNNALDYLIQEGFISSVKGWSVGVAIFGHLPKS